MTIINKRKDVNSIFKYMKYFLGVQCELMVDLVKVIVKNDFKEINKIESNEKYILQSLRDTYKMLVNLDDILEHPGVSNMVIKNHRRYNAPEYVEFDYDKRWGIVDNNFGLQENEKIKVKSKYVNRYKCHFSDFKRAQLKTDYKRRDLISTSIEINDYSGYFDSTDLLENYTYTHKSNLKWFLIQDLKNVINLISDNGDSTRYNIVYERYMLPLSAVLEVMIQSVEINGELTNTIKKEVEKILRAFVGEMSERENYLHLEKSLIKKDLNLVLENRLKTEIEVIESGKKFLGVQNKPLENNNEVFSLDIDVQNTINSFAKMK